MGFKKSPVRIRPPRPLLQIPPDSIISSTFQKVQVLQDDDRNLFLAFFLAVGAGLRKNEIARARWEWITEVDGQLWCQTDELGKDGQPISVPIITGQEQIGQFRKDTGPVLEGHKTEAIEGSSVVSGH